MVTEILNALLDVLLDTLRILPFLFAAYLLIEYIEHRASQKIVAAAARVGRFGPAVGAVSWILPHFSVAAVNLYAGRLISFGTLAAVFIATNDDALPLLLASPEHYHYLWIILLVKIILAVGFGFLADAVFKEKHSETGHQAHEHLHAGCGHDECGHGIWLPALRHTLKSELFVLLTLGVIETAVTLAGSERIAALFSASRLFQPLLAALMGFIPSCASSIVLTELFTGGALTFGSYLAGLITSAGVAYAVLFRASRDYKRNFALLGFLLLLALTCGYSFQLFVA